MGLSGAEITGIIVALTALLTAIGRGVAWLISLLTGQYKETIAELKESKHATELDRDHWRERALKAEAGRES